MKNWYQSKTIWIAVIAGISGIIGAVHTTYPDAGWATTAMSIVMFIMRIITTTGIGNTNGDWTITPVDQKTTN